jgi:hypothetical protein
MVTAVVVILMMASFGGGENGPIQSMFHPGGRIMVDGPGLGWGYRNGNPDGYGWVDYSQGLPLGNNRTSDYYFPRYHAVPADQMFFPTYYNPYITRGQRFIPNTNCGGDHLAGGPPTASAATPLHPYNDTLGTRVLRPQPTFNGRVEATPINPGTSGLRP